MPPNDDGFARAQARVGTVLRGKYRLDRVIGVGGMAAVYAASHRNGRDVAIKVLHPELSVRSDLLSRFLREAQAANAVKHPGVVAVLDDDVADDGATFLVMELLEGETVEELWGRSGERLSLETVLAVGLELCDVLAAAHAKGIIHRDIKPANLFVTTGGVLKVLDFGIARLRDTASSQKATTTGAVMGTPAFMAPEQAAGRASEVDAGTDIYAIGATMFGLASGAMVHEGETIQRIVIRTATTPARSLATVLPDAPAAIVGLVDRALAFDRADRWTKAGEMREAIRSAAVAVFGRAPRLPVSEPGHPAIHQAPSSKPSSPHRPTVVSEARRPLGLWGPETQPDEPAVALPGQGAALALSMMVGSTAYAEPAEQRRRLRARRRSQRSVLAVASLAGGVLLAAAVMVLRDCQDSSVRATPGAEPSPLVPAQPRPIDLLPLGPRPSSVVTGNEVVEETPAASVTSSAAAPARGGRPPPAHGTVLGSPGRRATVAATSDPSSAPAGTARAHCDPPYVVDSTGTKRWNEGCLDQP